MDRFSFFEDVKKHVPAYQKFLAENGVNNVKNWEDIPLMTKENYLLKYHTEETVREGEIEKCFLIGASSGFSKKGTVFWLKEAVNEDVYLKAVEDSLKDLYNIDKKKTLIVVSLAFGTWIAGIQLACTMRQLAGKTDYPLTACFPGLDLEEGAQIVKEYKNLYQQVLWITNVSNIPIIYSLLKDDKDLLDGYVYFPVVGEYFTENYRQSFARKFGHREDEEAALWTGYGSADTGDLGMESKKTIRLRKFLLKRPELCKEVFNSEDVPMILEKSGNAYIEIVEGNIVVTKDQLIPLIRYDTKDAGGLFEKGKLKGKIPEDLFNKLPETMLYVFGRVSDSVVFYGTNLKIPGINNFLNSLDESFKYSGLFEIEEKEIDGIAIFNFTIYTFDGDKSKEKEYKDRIIGFLKSYSREFNAKYDNLVKSSKTELINVNVKPISEKPSVKKHKFIKG